MLAVLQAAAVILLIPLRLRWALCTFLFFLAFSPRSLGLVFADNLTSLTFARMAFPFLLFAALYDAATNRQSSNIPRIRRLTKEPFFIILTTWSLLKLLSTLINDESLFHAIDGALFTVGALFVGYHLITPRLFKQVVITLLAATAITATVAAIELNVGKPLHHSIADPILYAQDLLVSRERGGEHRVQAIFDGVHMLAEFLLYMIPLILFQYTTSRTTGKLFALAIFFATIATIIATANRNTLILAPIITLAYLLAYYWPIINKNLRQLLLIAITALMCSAAIAALGFFDKMLDEAQRTAIYTHDAETRSLHSRALEYIEVYNAVTARPFFGYGVVGHVAAELDEIRRNDNYYLRTAVEAGIPGLILFVSFITALLLRILRFSPPKPDSTNRSLKPLLLSLTLSFALVKLFLSQPTNNVIFFILLGATVKLMYISLTSPMSGMTRVLTSTYHIGANVAPRTPPTTRSS